MQLNVEGCAFGLDTGKTDDFDDHGLFRLKDINNALFFAELQKDVSKSLDSYEGGPFDKEILGRRLETACTNLSEIYGLPEVPKFEITDISENGAVTVNVTPVVKRFEISFFVPKNADTRRLTKRSLFNSNKNKKVYRMRWFKIDTK